MELSVELRDVCKNFGAQPVVRDVCLEVKNGEFYSLLGPSGCGKSTTLRLIAGFEKPTSGSILINGEPTNGIPAYVRDVNLVFQNYALFPHMTVFDNIAFGLRMEKRSENDVSDRVGSLLDMVRMDEYGGRFPRQLSGGQQQRVALARALATEPSVVLLDEPLGALDLKLRKQMQIELKTLQEKLGLTFIYVTHDQEEALTMSDRIAVMHAGRVQQVGKPEQIYEKPVNKFVADFIGETNFLYGRVQSKTVERAGEKLTVDIDGMLVEGYAEPGFDVGEEVLLAIRPERLAIFPSAQPDPDTRDSAVRGVVEDSVYFGINTVYTVKLRNGERLRARQQNSPGGGIPQGTPVEVSWHIESVNVLVSEPV